jgi:predicted nucleic acid-binding protein
LKQDQLERHEALCALAKVQLYCNPATSEVTGEHSTLHEAIAAATPSIAGALLICDGVILATAVAHGWLFEQAGLDRIHNECNASGVGSGKK